MNTPKDTNFVSSNQYTPIYVIQNPGAAQANYVITVANLEQKPVSNNLKSFYENSGNIEGVVGSTLNTTPKPRILKKPDNAVVGNSLKLASFLLPKNDNIASKPYILNNFVFKPDGSAAQTETINTVPKLDIDRKIVKLKDVPIRPRNHIDRLPPKIKPREIIPINTQAKVTSVQLLKLGETYHSLNKLDNAQMRVDNQTLKILSDPEKIAPEPSCDPVSNTKFIYKVVAPKDLTIVGKKNIFIKDKRDEKKIDLIKKENVKKQIFVEEFENEPDPPAVTKVTRSGRTVKLPKLIVPQDKPHKRKKKNHIVTCFQCSTEFSSLYRLQKHYENHPTHIPAKIHSNLFHCLLAIVKGGSEGDRTNIFVQQLEQLIVKLKSLWPCLLNKTDGSEGKACTINEDVGRLFGMNSGKYNIDINALNCVKDKDGYCIHNPPLKKTNTEVSQPMQIHVAVPSEEISNFVPNNDDCARISSAENWPTVHKRVWKLKKLITQKINPKKMKLDNDDNSLIKIEIDDTAPPLAKVEDTNNIDMRLTYACDDLLSKLGIDSTKDLDDSAKLSEDMNVSIINQQLTENNIEDQSKSKGHLKFHSTHFDIRSSPIKPSSAVFHKFQIHPEKLPKYDVQMLGATDIIDSGQKKDFVQSNDESLQEIFANNIEPSCKQNSVMDQDWILAANDKSEDGYTKSNNLIEPALLHVKDSEKSLNINGNYQPNETSNDSQLIPNQEESVLQFFDALGNTCLSYPEMEIRASTNDFNLDLF